MTHDRPQSDLLAELADDFAARYRRGERPTPEDYALQYPALAGEIRALFPTIALMEQVEPDTGVPLAESAGQHIGPYKLLEQIGEGALGVVFMAEQQRPIRRKVALKVLKAGMDTRQVVARFEAERQALAMMEHENIAKVFDAGATDSGRPYFVMELVRGFSITAYCDDNHLPPRERLALFVQVCRAVQHAHTKGIIHRDLKPSNVLVTLHDGVPVPKIIDFGVAKAIEARLTERTLFTHFAQFVGTPLYMSPEQAEMSCLDVDARSDIYSLGVLLYELLIGVTPFEPERIRTAGIDEVRRIIREEEPPRPSARATTLGERLDAVAACRRSHARDLRAVFRGEVDWIVMKALEKDRRRRYETADALAADLMRYLDGEPVEACPPTLAYRLRKLARKHRGLLIQATAVALAAVLMLSVLAGFIGWQLHDRQTKQAIARQSVVQALQEGHAALEKGEWQEASGAAHEADVLLQTMGDKQLESSLGRLTDDLAFVRRLEAIRLERRFDSYSSGATRLGDFERTDTAYIRAFRDAGLDESYLASIEARARFRSRSIRTVLAIALDDWALGRLASNRDSSTWSPLLALAGAVDPDPHRSRLRKAVSEQSHARLLSIVTEAHAADLRPATAVLAAESLVLMNDARHAIEVLERCHARYPDDFWVNYLLATYYLKPLGSDELALPYATAAVALRPHGAAAHELLAHALYNVERPREALVAADTALGLQPNSVGAHLARARILLYLDRPQEAGAAAREAQRLDPQEWLADMHLVDALLMQGSPQDALAVADDCVLRLPQLAESHYAQARCRAALADWEGSARAAQKAIDLVDGMSHYYEILAQALFRLGRLDESGAAYQKSISIRPDDPELRVRAIAPWVATRSWGEAIRMVAEAVRIWRDDSARDTYLGEGRFALGHFDQAIMHWRRALARHPGDPFLTQRIEDAQDALAATERIVPPDAQDRAN